MTPKQTEVLDLSPLDRVLDGSNHEAGDLIPLLQRAQAIYGYLPPIVMNHIAERTDTPLSHLYGVVTFYSQFSLEKRGKCIIRQCDGTACHVKGSGRIIDLLSKELGVKPGETAPDYSVTLEVVYCMGSCGLAPVTVIDEKVEGRMDPRKMIQILRQTT